MRSRYVRFIREGVLGVKQSLRDMFAELAMCYYMVLALSDDERKICLLTQNASCLLKLLLTTQSP